MTLNSPVNPAAQAPVLGRGLSALLGPEDTTHTGGVSTLNVAVLKAGQAQPRHHFEGESLAELTASIKEKGVLQPLLVRELTPGNYEIIAGERRFRAAKEAGLQEVPVIIKAMTDLEALEIALIENIQRQDLNPLEEAQAYDKLMREFNYTQEQLAKAVSKSRSHLANMLRLLTLPAVVQQALASGQISAGHARALLATESPEAALVEVLQSNLSVRQTEALGKKAAILKSARTTPMPSASSETSAPLHEDILAIQEHLTAKLGLSVQIQLQGSAGTINLTFTDLHQLDRLIHVLSEGSRLHTT